MTHDTGFMAVKCKLLLRVSMAGGVPKDRDVHEKFLRETGKLGGELPDKGPAVLYKMPTDAALERDSKTMADRPEGVPTTCRNMVQVVEDLLNHFPIRNPDVSEELDRTAQSFRSCEVTINEVTRRVFAIRAADVRAHLNQAAETLGKFLREAIGEGKATGDDKLLRQYKATMRPRVYVVGPLDNGEYIPLRRADGAYICRPDHVRSVVTHTDNGSAFKRVECVNKPVLSFVLKFLPGALDAAEELTRMFTYGCTQGIGTDRSLQFGQYDARFKLPGDNEWREVNFVGPEVADSLASLDDGLVARFDDGPSAAEVG